MTIKMSEKDWDTWSNAGINLVRIEPNQLAIIAELHAKYFNHKYHRPCGCNKKEIKRWIEDLNLIFANGFE